jgi:hypothetical protein
MSHNLFLYNSVSLQLPSSYRIINCTQEEFGYCVIRRLLDLLTQLTISLLKISCMLVEVFASS